MTDTQELILIKDTLFSMAEAIADVLAESDKDNERIYRAIFKSLNKIEAYTKEKEEAEAQDEYREHSKEVENG